MLLGKIGRMFLKFWGFSHSKHTSSSQRQYPTIIEELCHKFSLADLRKSTNDFDRNRVIDIRAFGIKIYKGCLQHNDGSDYTVAVMRFEGEDSQAWEVFKNEIELLCQLRHPNIVSLVGFCNDEYEKIIVCQYMPNGSLSERLKGGELSWKKRLEICIGIARGLHYLHAGAKRTIIHRDINPRNILLDDNMQPKLAGFGFSIQGPHFMSKPKPETVDSIVGTTGDLPMEYTMYGTVTDKTDVYLFGKVLLEVVCGGKYVIMVAFMEKTVEEAIDPNIKGKIAPECWQVFVDITHRCLKYEADERPTMGEVEVELEHALWLQEQADITNTNGDYTLFSTTIIGMGVEQESNMEEIDTRDA